MKAGDLVAWYADGSKGIIAGVIDDLWLHVYWFDGFEGNYQKHKFRVLSEA
jgi:hypothetical protein